MNEHWFKPKRYGFGAAPKTWEGWLVIAIYVGAVAFLSAWFARAVEAGNVDAGLVYFPAVFVLTAALVFVSWRKSDGPWRWRGGDDA